MLRATSPPHTVANNNGTAQACTKGDQQELIGHAEQNAHMSINAPANQFCYQRKLLKIELIDHLHRGDIKRPCIHLRGPTTIDFGHGPSMIGTGSGANFYSGCVNSC